MRRIVAFVPFLLLAAPIAAHASGIPYFGPIVPTVGSTCAAGWALLVTVVNNIITFALTIAIVFVAPLLIAYAGFLYLTSGTSPSNRSKANSILTNTIVGIVIALASWIIVDMVMSVFYNGKFGSWYSIVQSGGNTCIPLASSLNEVALGNGSYGLITGVGSDNGALIQNGAGACNPANLTAADPSLSSSEANTLACIAQPESSCGANTSGATTPSGKPTSAAGPFQIVFGSSNDSCHNLNVSACESLNSGQPLNCYQHFSGGKPKPNDPMAQQCIAAANNLSCAAAAADCLVKADKGYSAWQADSRSSAQSKCIATFAT